MLVLQTLYSSFVFSSIVVPLNAFSSTFLNFARPVSLNGNYYGNVDPDNDGIEIMPGDRNAYAAEITNLSAVFVIIRKKLYDAHVRYSNV
jgi:hypothetical protein